MLPGSVFKIKSKAKLIKIGKKPTPKGGVNI